MTRGQMLTEKYAIKSWTCNCAQGQVMSHALVRCWWYAISPLPGKSLQSPQFAETSLILSCTPVGSAQHRPS